ncbi:MAG: anti-sigma regulatory factor, partial [Bacteroidales bacterium]|nr:anti-sigma regulatory factor [Bacteroidales bacterium]
VDEGKGIPDIEQAMQKGFSTASVKVREMGFGAGMGLPNIKDNSDKLNITSVPGKGTTVEITNYFNK